eukprot:TRINITY_DN43321_c0_g1_i1.p1 TRINITY_DN43321_c0_g1~~TRINITY_DN43321_c0_g1_i1.p1  ORF type:complete len:462 (-),score=35.98 TRINITY_DN43321_c0_g1_i1:21-1385(-)
MVQVSHGLRAIYSIHIAIPWSYPLLVLCTRLDESDRRTAAYDRLLSIAQLSCLQKLADRTDDSPQAMIQASDTTLSSTSQITEGFVRDQVVGPIVYTCASMAVVGIISLIFYRLGAFAVVAINSYIGCLSIIKIVIKLVYARQFRFPVFLTAVHLLASTIAAFLFLTCRRYVTGKPIVVPSVHDFFYIIFPIAFTFGSSIVCENTALVYVSASFAESVSATTPVVSAFICRLLGVSFDLVLLLPMAIVVGGCVINAVGAVAFSWLGLLLMLASICQRSVKVVMQQSVLSGSQNGKFDTVTLMMWTCMFSCFELTALSIVSEGSEPVIAIKAAQDVSGLITAIAVSCVIAVSLNLLILIVIWQIGAVEMEIISQMKTILSIIGAVTILHETVSLLQVAGITILLFGILLFSYMKRSVSAEADEKETMKEEEVFPRSEGQRDAPRIPRLLSVSSSR